MQWSRLICHARLALTLELVKHTIQVSMWKETLLGLGTLLPRSYLIGYIVVKWRHQQELSGIDVRCDQTIQNQWERRITKELKT